MSTGSGVEDIEADVKKQEEFFRMRGASVDDARALALAMIENDRVRQELEAKEKLEAEAAAKAAANAKPVNSQPQPIEECTEEEEDDAEMWGFVDNAPDQCVDDCENSEHGHFVPLAGAMSVEVVDEQDDLSGAAVEPQYEWSAPENETWEEEDEHVARGNAVTSAPTQATAPEPAPAPVAAVEERVAAATTAVSNLSVTRDDGATGATSASVDSGADGDDGEGEGEDSFDVDPAATAAKKAAEEAATESEEDKDKFDTSASMWTMPPDPTGEELEELKKMQGRATKGAAVDQKHAMFAFTSVLTKGMRESVQRAARAERDAPLSKDDFKFYPEEVVSIDIESNNASDGAGASAEDSNAPATSKATSPGAKGVVMKFKDYAPAVFQKLRTLFNVNEKEYLESMCGPKPLTQLGAASLQSKSGQIFYFSADGRYMAKTVVKSEAKFLKKILKKYYHHMERFPHTTVCRFFGLHRVSPPGLHIVVMGNAFDTERVIHERFDLKGSSHNRRSTPEQRKNKHAILKDLDFLDTGHRISLGPRKSEFMHQLRIDADLLAELCIMDYSLLLGIHYRDRARPTKLKAPPPQPAAPKGNPKGGRKGSLAVLETSHTSKFQSDGGGMASILPDGSLGPELYYMCTIDILQKYNMGKKFETAIKAPRHGGKQAISSVSPEFYAERFVAFMDGLID